MEKNMNWQNSDGEKKDGSRHAGPGRGQRDADLVSLVERSFGVSFRTLTWWFVAVMLLAGVVIVFSDWDPEKRPAAQPPGEMGQGTAPLPAVFAGLNKGKMANFLFKKTLAPVPAFKMVDENGRTLTLADFKGRVVLLNIWATWCAPCRHEMPSLDRLQAALGGDGRFVVVALSIDRGGLDKPRRFYQEVGIKHLALYGDPTGGRVGPVLGVVGMPTTLLIDGAGREIGRLTGPAEWDTAEAQALMRAAIGQLPPPRSAAVARGVAGG